MNFYKKRIPIVVLAGHIDHGKTTLLNYIRKNFSKIKEYGGITQHINAFNVETSFGKITFIDTPGHSAFDFIRKKCIQFTDIILLVISLEDGIKPQTLEVINCAKIYKISVIVVFTKIDKEFNEIKIEKLKNDLAKFDLISDSWGGENLFTFVSAKTGVGIDDLLSKIILQSDILELKSDYNAKPDGIIIDNMINSKIGMVTSIIILNGILKLGDYFFSEKAHGKIKNIKDFNLNIKEAYPGMAVNITGISGSITIGEKFNVIDKIKSIEKNDTILNKKKYSIFDISKNMTSKNENLKLNLILKADLDGSVSVIKNIINNFSKEKNFPINIIKISIGDFITSDIDLAKITNAKLIGFNVKINQKIKKYSLENKIHIINFNIIYEFTNFLENEFENISLQEEEKNILGIADVKKVFKQDLIKNIAGCLITYGKIKDNSNIKIFRKNKLVFNGVLESIKVFKENKKEVFSGTECGISIKDYNSIQINDKIKAYK
jgi:translation initiation factor IF-2